MNGEHKPQLRTNYKPKQNIDKNFTINSSYHESTRRHYATSPGENKKIDESPKGRRHIQTPHNKDHIVFETPIEKERPKPFEKPRPNTKPEFHSKKFAPSRPILKSINASSISFNYCADNNANTNNAKRNINTRIDPASLPAAGYKTGFHGIR
ncbi:hypothetical protein BCR36DRAFT_587414 [Piromyces finnis]|uniref:Uncharacterized protein n=1 Tax=Piromyces finnis TaxID=1754191 RepID=A0A1Y1UVU7_9FUNG|nr:hypothetical protein BCR36DRAFT_587414 [Piromyces finnis]|eukprot:ORX42117.1 hypothetical protein BCR36DRAFT_587414 [Piromyces finnis]